MNDVPPHVTEAIKRLQSVPRKKNIWDVTGQEWRVSLYYAGDGKFIENYQDDLRTVAYWCIDQQIPIDT
jgi:hypothetical protein